MLTNIVTKTFFDRWKGFVFGTLSIGVLLILGMSVYRNIDLSVYTDLPEVFLSLMNIPTDANIGTLAYGAIYSSYGTLTLAAFAISMGSASIAREELGGTIGILLGNPKSRSHVLASKTATMVLLTAVGALVLYGFGVIAPSILDVALGDMHVGALVFHMLIIALFHGFLALVVGAWTGRAGFASGVSAGLMVVSFIAVGLLPLIESLANLAKVFPWYYYESSDPVINGFHWAHLGVLGIGMILLGVLAFVGVNRRDLRDKTEGRSLVDRLRNYPLTKKIVDRLAGSARVSRIWVKTLSDHQILLIVTAYVMFLIMGVLIGPMYNFIDEAFRSFTDVFPEALLALFGGGDLGTPEGFYQLETFGMMAPLAVMVVTVAMGAKALAGEEANRTMGLLLANPIKRSSVLLEKAWAMTVAAAVVGTCTFFGVVAGSALGGLGMDWANIGAVSLLVTLLGTVFGMLALSLSAATGEVRSSTFIASGVALVLYVMNAFLPFSDRLAGLAKLSPFYYYLTSNPLINGMDWGDAVVLVALIAVLLGAALFLFERRDLRQTG